MQYSMVDGLFGGWNLEGFALGEIPNFTDIVSPKCFCAKSQLGILEFGEFWKDKKYISDH